MVRRRPERAFSSDRDGLYNIYVMNADGTNVVRLTQNAFIVSLRNGAPLPPFLSYQLSGRVMTPDGRGLAATVAAHGFQTYSPGR